MNAIEKAIEALDQAYVWLGCDGHHTEAMACKEALQALKALKDHDHEIK